MRVVIVGASGNAGTALVRRLRQEPDVEIAGVARRLLGTQFVTTLLTQCEIWPRGRRPTDFNEPVASDRPALPMS